MNRTMLLQERRMRSFHDVLGHWQARRLSALEAAELLGMSERSFRRYRQRYEDEGLDGLSDRRLGKASARRVPADRVAWVLDEYRTRYRGWTVKHFHDRLRDRHGFAWSYTWTKTVLQRAGLVPKAPRRGAHRRRRPRKPCVGMMLHQDGSRHEWLAGQAACDLIVTMDDASSEIYSAFLVEEEGTASTFRALKQVFTDKGLPGTVRVGWGLRSLRSNQSPRIWYRPIALPGHRDPAGGFLSHWIHAPLDHGQAPSLDKRSLLGGLGGRRGLDVCDIRIVQAGHRRQRPRAKTIPN